MHAKQALLECVAALLISVSSDDCATSVESDVLPACARIIHVHFCNHQIEFIAVRDCQLISIEHAGIVLSYKHPLRRAGRTNRDAARRDLPAQEGGVAGSDNGNDGGRHGRDSQCARSPRGSTGAVATMTGLQGVDSRSCQRHDRGRSGQAYICLRKATHSSVESEEQLRTGPGQVCLQIAVEHEL